jgi:hypothetical protein
MKIILALAMSAGVLLAATARSDAQYYERPYYAPSPYYGGGYYAQPPRYYREPRGYRGYGYNRGRREYNPCPPYWTIQNGVCKPYRGY